MSAIIGAQLAELRRLCARYHVRRLEVFGSATDAAAFDPRMSDLDFLVEFDDLTPAERADSYLGLLLDLEALFARPVDLIETSAIENPYFLRAIAASRQTIYAAA